MICPRPPAGGDHIWDKASDFPLVGTGVETCEKVHSDLGQEAWGCCPEPCPAPPPAQPQGTPLIPSPYQPSWPPHPPGSLGLEKILYDPMLRYVLLKVPMPASMVTSARLHPGAPSPSPSPSPPPTSGCQAVRQLHTTATPSLPEQGPGQAVRGPCDKENPADKDRLETQDDDPVCSHTPPGPAAPPGGARFREVEGKSKVAQRIR